MLPVALGFQGVGHFLGHVVLVVLGQHFVGLEEAALRESSELYTFTPR